MLLCRSILQNGEDTPADKANNLEMVEQEERTWVPAETMEPLQVQTHCPWGMPE